MNAAADVLIAVVKNAEKLIIDDVIERPKPVFNFTKVDENYHKLLERSMNKKKDDNESNISILKIFKFIKNLSFFKIYLFHNLFTHSLF